MLYWLILLLGAAAAFGALLLRVACVRHERPEGWEDRKIAASGDAAWQEAWQAGKKWLEGRELEDVEVQSEDGFLLHGVLIQHIAPRATALLFHGWRGSWEENFLCVLPFLHSLGLQCLLVDERAQGDSEGHYITFGVRERQDAAAWVRYAANRFGREHPLFLQGLSMGATAVLMASPMSFADANVRGVIADCGFTSPEEIITAVWRKKTHLPGFFAAWLLDVYTRAFAGFSLWEHSALSAVRKARYPILFIHGTADGFVPCEMTKRMYEACKSEKTLVLVDGADHGKSWLTDRARVEAAYRAFADACLGKEKGEA